MISALDPASVALDLADVARLSATDLAQLPAAGRAVAYGLAYAWVRRQLADRDTRTGDRIPVVPPAELTPAAGDAAMLRTWARQEIDPARLRRWAVSCFAADLRAVIAVNPHGATSIDAFLATMPVSLSIDDAAFESIQGDPSLRELVTL